MKKIFIMTVMIAAGYLIIKHSGLTEKLVKLLPSHQFERLDKNISDKLTNRINEEFLVFKAELNNLHQQNKLNINDEIKDLSEQVLILTKQVESFQSAGIEKLKPVRIKPLIAEGEITYTEQTIEENTDTEFATTQGIELAQTSRLNNELPTQQLPNNFIAKTRVLDENKSYKLQRIIERMEHQSLQLLTNE